MALETPEMDRLVTFHRLSKKNLGKNNNFSIFYVGLNIFQKFQRNSKEIKGKTKGNQRKCKGKSKEIKGNVKGIFGRCPNLPKIIEKILFLPRFFFESR